MFNEYNLLQNRVKSVPQFSEHALAPVLLQTYQEWLKERFNDTTPVSDETRSMLL